MFLVGGKTLKFKVTNYSNFTFTFPIWRCAGYFFKVLLKFKMTATDQLQCFCFCVKAEMIPILPSYFPRYGAVQEICFKILLKFKMAAADELQFFVGAKTKKLKDRNYSNFSITFPTI